MKRQTTEIFAGAAGDLRGAWPRLLATDMIYKVIAYAILTPLVGAALRLFVQSSGSKVVADQDILYFFLSPIGLATLVVGVAISLAIVTFEYACLMTIGMGEVRDTHVTTTGALRYGAHHAWAMLLLTVHVTARVLLISAPFLAAGGLLYVLLLGGHDINYYLADKPPVFLVTAALVGLLVVAMATVVIRRLLSWSFALPLVLFEGLAARPAMTTSAQRVMGHRTTVAMVLVGWGLLASLVSTIPLAAAAAVARTIVPPLSQNIGALVIAVGGVVLLWAGLNLLVSMVTFAVFALLSVRLYQSYGSSEEAQQLKGLKTKRAKATWALRLSRKTIFVVLLLAFLAASGAGYVLMQRFGADADAFVIAHRGAAGRAPENTLASVAAALEDGADFVEIDVQETLDGRVIVIHDADFMRIGGNPIRVWEGTFDQVRQIDIGSWFSPEFSDQRPPTLEEVLELCKGQARVVIELKYYGHDQQLEQRVVDIVEATGMTYQVIVMSLKAEMVGKMKSLRPEWTVGLLTATAIGDLTTVDADFLAVHSGMATGAFIRRAHRTGKDVYVWTVNDPRNMFSMMTAGVDGIITDEPALAREVIAVRADLSSGERLMVAAALWMGIEIEEPPAESDLN
jgi:glycerophosphoryl diester phosphodiesterase